MRNLKMKFRRIELEMSQTDLAKACGVKVYLQGTGSYT